MKLAAARQWMDDHEPAVRLAFRLVVVICLVLAIVRIEAAIIVADAAYAEAVFSKELAHEAYKAADRAEKSADASRLACALRR